MAAKHVRGTNHRIGDRLRPALARLVSALRRLNYGANRPSGGPMAAIDDRLHPPLARLVSALRVRIPA